VGVAVLLAVLLLARCTAMPKNEERPGGETAPVVGKGPGSEEGAGREGPTRWLGRDAGGWSGSGFWIGPLEHVGADGRVEDYPSLRLRLRLSDQRQVVTAAFSVDQKLVAILIQDGDAKGGFMADLVIAPTGEMLMLRAGAPGTALIRTAAPDRANWVSLSGEGKEPGLKAVGRRRPSGRRTARICSSG
jgi:hypothetical protein